MAENCTLNPDGSLKDTSEIPWEYSPSHRFSQLPETHTNRGTSAVLRPGILDLKAPMSATLSGGTAAGLKHKWGEPELHSKLKENGHGSTQIKSLNLGMSGTYKVEFCNPSLTRIISMLEITFAESPGDSEASQSAEIGPEAKQETKRVKSNATKDIYGSKIEGVFRRVDEKTSECCVCV